MSHHHSHSGPHSHSSDNIRTAFFLNIFFVVVELIGGYFTNSLAIVADALHDIGDSLALGLAWYLDKKSKGARTIQFSYGLGRLSLLSALFTSLVLFIGSLVVFSQAVPRLLQPEHSDAQGMILFAIFGILINGTAALRLKKGTTLNEKAIFWHMLEDVLGWVAILFTGIFIYFQDVHFLDPLLSILIAAYVLWNTIKNLKATVITFLQGVPEGMSIEGIETAIKAHKDILEVHDTHIWTLDGEKHVLTSHVVIDERLTETEVAVLKCDIKKILNEMHIGHSTIELERQGEECQLGSC